MLLLGLSYCSSKKLLFSQMLFMGLLGNGFSMVGMDLSLIRVKELFCSLN